MNLTYALDLTTGQTISLNGQPYAVRSARPSPVYADTVQVAARSLWHGETDDGDPMATLTILYLDSTTLVSVLS